jgi:pimeloyl-ACP methyl ester carboxylesterase
MLEMILLALVALVVSAVLLYLSAPRLLFNAARKALRRKGGLVEKSITVSGLNWPYLEGGNPQGTPLVLVHGFGGDKDNWSFYAPFLTGPYRLICPDLPGFGDTSRDPSLDYDCRLQAERLGEFLDALGIGKCHLGGNSMGGYIALLFALADPDRLSSLTLFNNAGVLGTEPSELQAMVEAEPGSSPLVPHSPDEMRDLLAFIVHKPRFIPRRFLELLHGDLKPHLPLLDRIFAQLLAEMLERPLNDELHRLKVPTLIIWGRHDRLIHHTSATVQHGAIAGSELVIFEDVGHVPMIEKPAQTARHHLAFLAKH